MTNEHPHNTHQLPQGVHLVGSIPLHNADEVFHATSSILGDRLHRIPDGETGIRSGWIGWQLQFFAENPSFERVPPDPTAYSPRPRFKLRSQLPVADVTFEQLGYADAAIASYDVFSQLKRAGVIPTHTRFQVSVPTPIAPITSFVIEEEQARVEPAYEAAMLRELARISAAVPHNELAIQWDTAIEFAVLEGVRPANLSHTKAAILERLIRLGNSVPLPIELGFHLCYGDAGHQHFKEPEDTTKLVEVANALTVGITRPLQWIHMPVPRGRADAAYFAPLRQLKLPAETEFYLGLVHFTDGVEGTKRRIQVAQQFVTDFGVATECGMGRRSPDTILELLRIHREVSAPYAGTR